MIVNKDIEIIFTFGDRHYPSNDKRIDSIILQIIKDIKPSIIIDGGDGLDGDMLSNFDKTTDQLSGFQKQLDSDYEWRESINKVSPKSTKILLECNHFSARLSKLTKKNNYWASDLRVLEQKNLQKLDELDWELMEHYIYKNSIMYVHGDGGLGVGSNKAPINQVRAMMKESTMSVVRYHSHTSGIEIHRKGKGTCFACQVGTTYDLRKSPNYIKHGQYVTNWTNSLLVVVYDKNTRVSFPSLIPIINGEAYFNNKLYKSK